jgi:hypothetical protein
MTISDDPQRKGASVTPSRVGCHHVLVNQRPDLGVYVRDYLRAGPAQRYPHYQAGNRGERSRHSLSNVETQLARIDANVTFLAEQAREERARRK